PHHDHAPVDVPARPRRPRGPRHGRRAGVARPRPRPVADAVAGDAAAASALAGRGVRVRVHLLVRRAGDQPVPHLPRPDHAAGGDGAVRRVPRGPDARRRVHRADPAGGHAARGLQPVHQVRPGPVRSRQGMTALTIDDVSKSFGSTPVLDGIRVDVEAGELVSLLGPSGCGKTTTLNVVAGFLPADSGRVLLAGTDVTTVPPYRRDTAVVFQNYALFPHLRVRDNVAYGLRARKLPAAEVAERVQAALELMDIAELADRYPGQLSGGQQQRVAVARAVAVRPRVLL